jgi:hypothetical protein
MCSGIRRYIAFFAPSFKHHRDYQLRHVRLAVCLSVRLSVRTEQLNVSCVRRLNKIYPDFKIYFKIEQNNKTKQQK